MIQGDPAERGLRLGIDTGGTYTDAALVSDTQELAASAKSLTTHSDLSVGICEVINALPQDKLSRVGLVSLSTTLATNAVVEGRGTPVCLLLAGYKTHQIERSRLDLAVRGGHCVLLSGSHDAGGREAQPLDTKEAVASIEKYRDHVSAFGISGLFSVRNPAHEIALRDLVQTLSGKPVTCGYELATSLDAPRRAVTVAFNASLVPFIHQLIRAIQRILVEHGIHAPLMVVKGDGSLVAAEVALQKPVETVLSGPAASVVGASFLSGARSAIVADMGGTTTDIAIVTRGQPAISTDATLIGDWRPMIEAIRVFSVGLGGDSEVRFSGGEGLGIGPRRVIPMSLLAVSYPEVLDTLKRQRHGVATPRSNRFALQLFTDDSQLSELSSLQRTTWEQLSVAPLELDTLTATAPDKARAVAALVRNGMAIYSGFTPSDAAHVMGIADHWSTEAAQLATVIWARQMRHVYGWGNFDPEDTVTASRRVHKKVISIICRTILRACLATDSSHQNRAQLEKVSRLFADWITGGGQIDDGLLSINFNPEQSLVAVGAPACLYYPDASRLLGINLLLPEHSEVANAIGAVVGSVVQREHITITQPAQGVFRAHTRDAPRDFTDLKSACSWAETIALERARDRAARSGAVAINTTVTRDTNAVESDDQHNEVFFEARVTATASGRPAFARIPKQAPEQQYHCSHTGTASP